MRYFKRHKFLSIIILLLSIYLYTNYTRIIEVNPKIDKTSEAYVNDIYMSDERIYHNYLNEIEKQAYSELKEMFFKRESKRTLDLVKYDNKSPDEVSQAIMVAGRAMMIDHPEMLQFSTFGYSHDGVDVEARVEFAINNPVMESLNTLRIRRIIDNIRIATKDMSDREKIKYVYEWIGDNNTYDDLFTYFSNEYMQKNKQIVDTLKAHSNYYWTNDLAYDLLCNIFNISSNCFDEANSLASTKFKFRKEDLRTSGGPIKE